MVTVGDEADRWLEELRHRRWTLHFYPDRRTPELIGEVFEWKANKCADVVILRGHDNAVAYRMPMHDKADVFAPEWVTWWWAQDDHPNAAAWTLRAVLSLAPPSPDDQAQLCTAPWFCHIPTEQRRPVTIRPT